MRPDAQTPGRTENSAPCGLSGLQSDPEAGADTHGPIRPQAVPSTLLAGQAHGTAGPHSAGRVVWGAVSCWPLQEQELGAALVHEVPPDHQQEYVWVRGTRMPP